MHALGDDSQLSSIHCRRFKGGWIYRRKTSLPSVSDRLWNAFRNNEDRLPSTTFFSLPYFLFIWPPSLRWAFIYCLIYRHPPCRAANIYFISVEFDPEIRRRGQEQSGTWSLEIYAKILKALAGELSICN